jgi:DNA-binding NarL/FixJ family response regulator
MIRVAIVEDYTDLRTFFEKMVAKDNRMLVAGSWGTAEEALREIPKTEVNVVLMDVHLPYRSGLDLTRRIKATYPEIEVLILTACDETDQILDALRAGASGYLLKRASPQEILHGIADVARGGSPMSSEIARRVVSSFKETEFVPPPESDPLTERESEVLRWMSLGYAEKEIASRLYVSLNTVKTHRKHIYQKLQIHSRETIYRKRELSRRPLV